MVRERAGARARPHPEADYHERYTKDDKLQDGAEIEWPVPFWFVDAGAALMLLLLAAIDEGLAAGVYGVPVEEELRWRELLGIPEDLRIVAGATVGRPLPDPGWSRVTSRATHGRPTLDELVGWNRCPDRSFEPVDDHRPVTALYRKYRPQDFDDVVGQEAVVRTLRNAIELDQLRQAYLFAGPRGTGKTSMARILAKALNCAAVAPRPRRPTRSATPASRSRTGRRSTSSRWTLPRSAGSTTSARSASA